MVSVTVTVSVFVTVTVFVSPPPPQAASVSTAAVADNRVQRPTRPPIGITAYASPTRFAEMRMATADPAPDDESIVLVRLGREGRSARRSPLRESSDELCPAGDRDVVLEQVDDVTWDQLGECLYHRTRKGIPIRKAGCPVDEVE